MTNIDKLKTLYNMQSHKAEKVIDLLDNHLPYSYSKKVVEIAKKRRLETSETLVRNVKGLINKNLHILNIILEVAKSHKNLMELEQEKLNQIISNESNC